MNNQGILYVVATPIGNLEDISFRAVRILSEVSTILCEDTRVSKKLLDYYDIHTPLLSYHAQSSEHKHDQIIARLSSGENLALISDAGTPTISDPGVKLIESLRTELGEDCRIVPIPGASALIAAFSVSGITGNQFVFMGYLPHKKGRATLFQEISDAARPVIFYESPHRIQKTLESLVEYVPQRTVVIARELTKMHEEVVRGTAQELAEYFTDNHEKVRGEFVVMVDA